MKYTNKLGLPNAFHRAVINDPYTKGESDYTATGLATPARAQRLIEFHYDTLEIDISTRVATTLGQGAHAILERAKRPDIDIIERRYYAAFVVDGKEYIVSAQIDLFETDTLTLWDWKTTKAYAFHKKSGSGKKIEWIQQLNVAAEIMRRQWPKPIEVKGIKIAGILKDWDKRKAITEPGYPIAEIMTVELPLWSSEETEGYIVKRIQAHEASKAYLPLCSAGETWNGNRCPSWCDAASVCEQYKQTSQTGLMEE